MNEREEQLAALDVEARDEARMNDYLLPPDPDGLNRALDRAAAEHLREVAPHLAPCLSCQAGLCAEHGPTVTATTTGATPPRAEPTGIRERLGRTDRYVPECETCKSGAERCPEHGLVRYGTPPAPEAADEMSREDFDSLEERLIPYWRQGVYVGLAEMQGNRDMAMEHVERGKEALQPVVVAWTALRASRDEERARADMYSDLHAKECQDGAQRLSAALLERDEAREQREDLANEILAERSDLAAANARAEEAERDTRTAAEACDEALRQRDTERAARVAAETEREAYRQDRDLTAHRLAAAEAEVKRRDEYPHPCLICFGTRPHSGKPCACGGTNNVYKAIEYAMDAWAKGEVREEGYIRENAALRARVARLEEAGDAMASGNLGLADMRARWAAAKADATAKAETPRT